MIGLAMALAAAAGPEIGENPVRPRSLEPMANWFSSHDYPIDAMRRGAQGSTRVRLVIDERGNVDSCEVTESSSDASLDAATCSIMSIRGRFEPARDYQGRAVQDFVEQRVRWVLPEEMPPTIPFEPARFVSSLHVTADGKADCSTNMADSPGMQAPGGCGIFAGVRTLPFLRATHADTTVTAILLIVPEGTAVPGGSADYGRMMLDTEAALDIAADGEVAACRSVRFRQAMLLPGAPASPDACAPFPVASYPIFAAGGAPDQLRRVRIAMTIFLRGGAAARER